MPSPPQNDKTPAKIGQKRAEKRVRKAGRKAERLASKAQKAEQRQKHLTAKVRKAADRATALCDVLESVSTPKQARSAQTLARILDAAERLILERGVSDVSINDIVRAAGSSVGGFYGRFRDKEELLVALSERTQIAFRQKVERLMEPERWADASLQEILHACTRELVSHIAQRSRLQAAFLHSVAVRPERWENGIAFRRQLTEGVAMLLLTRRDEITHPHPERATRFAIEAVLALMDQRALFGDLAGSWQLDEEALVQETERLVLGYLRVG